MRLFVSVILILALTLTGADPSPGSEPGPEPGPDACSRLDSPLLLQDKTPVLGRFHFMVGFSDNDLFRAILTLTSSFWVNITETQSGLGMDQFNKMNGTCLRTKANATLDGDTLRVTSANITSEARFLRLSESSLVLNISAFAVDVRDFVRRLHLDPDRFSPDLKVRSFYLMSRKSSVSGRDLQLFRVYAQCEGFRGDPDYSHQNQEFCSEDESVLAIF
ncbi:uncharacterized protein [Eucyclogobius newberryi]|uniref:uncharacterized protein isoform X5 n=1 Tax=Eucyclogobius newberryi TaxID=166745 RepID=UPI003B5BB989